MSDSGEIESLSFHTLERRFAIHLLQTVDKYRAHAVIYWSAKALIDNGYIPANPNGRVYFDDGEIKFIKILGTKFTDNRIIVYRRRKDA